MNILSRQFYFQRHFKNKYLHDINKEDIQRQTIAPYTMSIVSDVQENWIFFCWKKKRQN